MAFTGVGHDRAGKFELADDGTLFLDKIGELVKNVTVSGRRNGRWLKKEEP